MTEKEEEEIRVWLESRHRDRLASSGHGCLAPGPCSCSIICACYCAIILESCGHKRAGLYFPTDIEKARIGRAFCESPKLTESDGMTTRIPKNSVFASRLARWRRGNPWGRFLKKALKKGDTAALGAFPFLNWLPKSQKKLAPRQRRPSPAPRIRTQSRTRIRARRSPASQRRATTDSGGTDGDGDPEPPRRPYSSLPATGGAL